MDRNSDNPFLAGSTREPLDEPRAIAVRYDARMRRVVVELTNGMALCVPAALLQGLEHATASQLRHGRVRGRGTALRWDALDADVYVPALFQGILGTQQWMAELGRAGGRATSLRKVRAARANGRKGGRPRKHTRV